MTQIIYQFCDGTKSIVEVEDDFANELANLDKQISRNDRKETRRHTSFDYLSEQGIELQDDEVGLDERLELRETRKAVNLAINQLNEKQQKLVYAVYFEKKSLAEIAREKGVSKSAITQQMQIIYRKLKEILKNF